MMLKQRVTLYWILSLWTKDCTDRCIR